MTRRPKLLLLRIASVALSLIVALGICEVAVRLLYPKYEYSAKSAYSRDTDRIWARAPNVSYERAHPDTGERHLVHHNNLGLRDDRDYSDENLRNSTTLGFFGDSFVENLRLPVEDTFTKKLEHLLNETGAPFSVLNFGVDGYGTDQSFLQYREFAESHKLDHVFYVFSSNDLRNIRENRLFELNDADEPILLPPQPSSLWVRLVSRFYLTYFIVERIDGIVSEDRDPNKAVDLDAFLAHAETYHSAESDQVQSDFVLSQPNEELNKTIALFNAILRQWKNEVETNGGQFHIVLLPRYPETLILPLLSEGEFNIIDLYARFSTEIENYDYSMITFQNDGHWNENGNQRAAEELLKEIATADLDFERRGNN